MTVENFSVNNLGAIWEKHGLGKIETTSQPSGGRVNHCWIVNDAYVIRFDVLEDYDWPGISRYKGEKWAYDTLRGSGIPIPEVVAQDASKTLAPYDYIILTKLPGKMVYASRDEVTPGQVHDIAYAAGMHLAAMHANTFDGFGLLFNLAAGVNKTEWADYVAWFYADYAGQVRAAGLLDEDILARIEVMRERMRPLFAEVTRGHFVHGDYHYSNLLQDGGQLSGVLDFEWAMSGDPAWDFRIDDQLELALPGSKAAFYTGYTARRALDAHHAERVVFYKLGLYLDYLTFEDEVEHDETREWLLKELTWLENHLSD